MAFQNVINALNATVHRDTISAPLVEQINIPFRNAVATFKYAMPQRSVNFLNARGLNVTAFGSHSHPHPVHKSIEINLLENVWSNYAVEDSSIMFMKESKFAKLQKLSPNFKNLHNYRFTGKDSVRYKSISSSPPDDPILFIHDALMYFSPSQILDLFCICPKLQKVYATLVVPPESDFCEKSFYPTIYKYKKMGQNIVYQLEDHAAGAYTQPKSALDWLKISKIVGQDFNLRISILESWGPVHSLLIEKGSAPCDADVDEVFFRIPEAVLLPNPKGLDQQVRDRLVPVKVYNTLFTYVRAVRSLRQTDPAGFVRTQMGKEEFDWVSPSAWDNLQTFALNTAAIRSNVEYVIFESPLAVFMDYLSRKSLVIKASVLPFCSLILWQSSRFLMSLNLKKINSLAICGKWVVAPRNKWYQFGQRKAPWFEFENEWVRKDFLNLESTRPICEEYPRIFRKYLPKQCPRWVTYASLLLALTPVFTFGWKRLCGAYETQQKNDLYHSYFHAEEWSLSFKRSPAFIKRAPFFPPGSLVEKPPVAKAPIDAFSIHPEILSKFAPVSEPEPVAKDEVKVPEVDATIPEEQLREIDVTSDDEQFDQFEDFEEERRKREEEPVIIHAAPAQEVELNPQSEPKPSKDSHDDAAQAQDSEIVQSESKPKDEIKMSPSQLFRILMRSTCQGTPFTLSGLETFDHNVGVMHLSGLSFQHNPKDLSQLKGRRAAFYSRDGFGYGHDFVYYPNRGWPAELAEVCSMFSRLYEADFNSVLLNAYDESSSIPFHADDEACYDDESPIVTINLRGYGQFQIKQRGSDEILSVNLSQGDVLTMPREFQKDHLHSVRDCRDGRVSLTLRHQICTVARTSKMRSNAVVDNEFSQDRPSRKSPKGQENQKPHQPKKVVRKPSPQSSPAPQRRYQKKAIPQSPPVQAAYSNDEHMHIDDFGYISFEDVEDQVISPERSALISDPSAVGPVRAFDEFHNCNFVKNTAKFLTRERNGSASYPKAPAGDCLLQAVSYRLKVSPKVLWESLANLLPNCQLDNEEIRAKGLTTDHLSALACLFDFQACVHNQKGDFNYGVVGRKVIHINHKPEKGNAPGHFFAGGKIVRQEFKPKFNQANDLCEHLEKFECQGARLPFKKVHSYQSETDRAKNLISNMKNGFEGIMANVDPLHPGAAKDQFLALDATMDIAVSKQVKLIHIAGFAGCGKSYPIQQLLKTSAFKNHKIAVPTTELRSEWKEAMLYPAAERWRISTWESSMLKSARVLVIDEIYKMPRGYLDLAIHADSSIELVIILGDPLQGEYHATHPASSNHRLSSEFDHLRPFIDYYCLWSRRIPKKVARVFNVPTTNEAPGVRACRRSLPGNCPILVNTTIGASAIAQLGHHCTTIASSQGSTYDVPACIMLDKHSSLLSKSASLVALTRSRQGVIFVGDKSILSGDSKSNVFFSNYWHDRQCDVRSEFSNVLQGLEIITEPLSVVPKLSGMGSKRAVRQRRKAARKILSLKDPVALNKAKRNDKLTPDSVHDVILDFNVPIIGDGQSNAPQISTHFLPETRRPLHFDLPSAIISDPSHEKVVISPPVYSQVYPGEDFFTLAALLVPAHDPEIKEILFKDERSNQFPLLNQPYDIGALPCSLLAATHNSMHDPTLLPASIDKRLRFRQSFEPYDISPKDELLGTILFSSLCKAYHRDPNVSIPFDERLFAECINFNEFAQLSSKTQAVIMANEYRSDPDWRLNAVRIFAKVQQKVNEGSIFGDWKACQTLALMQDSVILILGPVKKYQRIFDKKDRPASLYIHASHTPFDMSDWCKDHLTASMHVANDYSAFDQSQHGEAVVLEIKKMQRLNIPQNLIDLHAWLKTNVETQFGPLTCMRLTGEPGTYDDNTDYNIAVLHTEYEITDEPVMVSGDDSLIDREPPPNPIWPYVKPMLSLRFKKERSMNALFCGYYVGKQGACRSPLTMFAKLAMAFDDKSIKDKRLSYLTEFAVGHSLGEQMWELVPIEQVMYQSANFDFFCTQCPREEKVLLNLGEPDLEFMNQLFVTGSYISRPLFALLKSNIRKQYIRRHKSARIFESPEVDKNVNLLAEHEAFFS